MTLSETIFYQELYKTEVIFCRANIFLMINIRKAMPSRKSISITISLVEYFSVKINLSLQMKSFFINIFFSVKQHHPMKKYIFQNWTLFHNGLCSRQKPSVLFILSEWSMLFTYSKKNSLLGCNTHFPYNYNAFVLKCNIKINRFLTNTI